MWLKASLRLSLKQRRALLWLAVCGCLLTFSWAQTTNAPARLTAGIWRVGVLEQPALSESSGLAASRRYPEVFWTHNDTGGEPSFLFAINRRGEHLGGFEVKGARPIDWEAISADDAGNLYFADTGTNGL